MSVIGDGIVKPFVSGYTNFNLITFLADRISIFKRDFFLRRLVYTIALVTTPVPAFGKNGTPWFAV